MKAPDLLAHAKVVIPSFQWSGMLRGEWRVFISFSWAGLPVPMMLVNAVIAILQRCGQMTLLMPVCKTVKKSSFLGLLSSVLRGHNTDTVHAQDSWPNLFIYWKPMPVEAMEHGDSPQKASICHSPWPSKPCKRCFCTQEQQTDPHQVQIPGSELDICTSREKEKQEAAEVRICRGRQW